MTGAGTRLHFALFIVCMHLDQAACVGHSQTPDSVLAYSAFSTLAMASTGLIRVLSPAVKVLPPSIMESSLSGSLKICSVEFCIAVAQVLVASLPAVSVHRIIERHRNERRTQQTSTDHSV